MFLAHVFLSYSKKGENLPLFSLSEGRKFNRTVAKRMYRESLFLTRLQGHTVALNKNLD